VRYIKDEPFLDRKGGVVVSDDFPEGITSKGILELVGHWNPGLMQQVPLDINKIRHLQNCLDALDSEPVEGRIAFETTDFDVLKEVVPKMAVFIPVLAWHSPQIEKMVNEAEEHLPNE
jgi:hypothetical protein